MDRAASLFGLIGVVASKWPTVQTVLGGAVVVCLGLLAWVGTRGGIAGLERWVLGLNAPQKDRVLQAFGGAFRGILAAHAAPEAMLQQLITSFDEWQTVQNESRRRIEGLRRCGRHFWFVLASSVVTLVIGFLEQSPNYSCWASLIAAVFILWGIIDVAPIIRLILNEGFPPERSGDQLPAPSQALSVVAAPGAPTSGSPSGT